MKAKEALEITKSYGNKGILRREDIYQDINNAASAGCFSIVYKSHLLRADQRADLRKNGYYVTEHGKDGKVEIEWDLAPEENKQVLKASGPTAVIIICCIIYTIATVGFSLGGLIARLVQ